MSGLYEFDHEAEDLTDGIRVTSRSLRQYRSRVTLEHLSHTFQEVVVSNDANQHRILREFLKQVNVTSIKYIILVSVVTFLFQLFWAVCNPLLLTKQ